MGSMNKTSDLDRLFNIVKDTNSLTFFAFSIGLMLLIFTGFVIFFLCKKNKVYYHRRDVFFSGSNIPTRVEEESSNIWIFRCFLWTSDQIYSRLGIDALVLLKTNRMFLLISIIYSFLCLVGPLSIHVSQGADNKPLFIRTSLSVLTSNKNLLWVHFILIYVITGICMLVLYIEWKDVIKYKQRSFVDDPFRISSLLFTDVQNVGNIDTPNHTLSTKIRTIIGEEKQIVEYTLRNINIIQNVLQQHNHLVLKSRTEQGKLGYSTQGLDNELTEMNLSNKILENYEKVLQYSEKANHEPLNASLVALSNICLAQSFRCTTFSINSISVRVSLLPEPTALIWRNLELDRKIRYLHNGLINLLTALVIIFCSLPFVLVAAITKSITISDKHLVDIESVVIKTVLQYLVNTLIPVILVNVFLFMQRVIFQILSTYEDHVSLVNADKSVLKKMCIFNAIDTFFAFTFTTTLIDILIVFIEKPFEISIALATSIPVQSNFFVIYVAFQALVMMPWYLLRGNNYVLLKAVQFSNWVKNLFRKEKVIEWTDQSIRPFDSEYVYKYSNVILIFGIGLVFGLLSPLISIVWVPFFFLSYIFFAFEEERTNVNPYQHNGEFWPIVSDCVLAYLIFMQVIMIGIFAIKKISLLSFLTIPACFITFYYSRLLRSWFDTNFNFPTYDTMNSIHPLSLVELHDRCKFYYVKSFIPSQTETTDDLEWKYIFQRESRFLSPKPMS